MVEAKCVRVWDPLLRLFHWLLVLTFGLSWFTQEQNYALHLLAGYAVLALLLFRLAWGLIGGHYARFRSFRFGPTTTLHYVTDMLRLKPPRYLGHNPAGALLVLVLLAGLLVISLSGVALDAAENRAGPLAATRLFLYTDIIQEIHVWSTHIVLALIAIHLAGVLFSSLVHKENLLRAMIDGIKQE